MKLLSYGLDQRMEPRLAISLNGYAVDVMRASLWMKKNRNTQDYLKLASSMKLILQEWSHSFTLLKNLEQALQNLEFSKLGIYDRPLAQLETDIVFFAPVPDPPSLRYFSAFNTGIGFNFGNTQTLLGHNQTLTQADLTPQGELCAIIGGKESGLQIAGYCIANNWLNTHHLNPKEGLAQGIATSLGPYLVSADELDAHRLGKSFSLEMQIRLNGKDVAKASYGKMTQKFENMLHEAAPTHVQAGDLFCSGSPVDIQTMQAIKQGDHIDVEIQVLGTLSNSHS